MSKRVKRFLAYSAVFLLVYGVIVWDQERLLHLKTNDPDAYIEEMKNRSDEEYLEALKELKPEEYESEKQRIEEERRQREFALRYPFIGILSCSYAGSPVVIQGCFTKTDWRVGYLLVRNGNSGATYEPYELGYNFGTIDENTLKLHFDLQQDFIIYARRNGAVGLTLRLEIIERETNEIFIQKSTSTKYGAINVSNVEQY